MATKTADAGHDYVQPRSDYRGITTMISTAIANGTSISTGDVYWMLKIPNRAIITDLRGFGRSSGTAGIVFNVGTTGSASLFGPFTISTTQQYVNLTSGASATQVFPYAVSLSDDAAVQFVTLAMTVASGSITATGTFGLIASYVMPGNAGP